VSMSLESSVCSFFNEFVFLCISGAVRTLLGWGTNCHDIRAFDNSKEYRGGGDLQ
jgi:hypothetical protein